MEIDGDYLLSVKNNSDSPPKPKPRRKGRREMTEEQREKARLRVKRYQANLPKEQREKARLRDIRRRANLTEEQRERRQTYERIYRSNFTEERREKGRILCRQYRANLTEEQREWQRIQKRKYTSNLTDEQREKKRIRAKRYRDNLTEEKRIRIKMQSKKYRDSMTEEQKERLRMQKNIHNKKRKGNLVDVDEVEIQFEAFEGPRHQNDINTAVECPIEYPEIRIQPEATIKRRVSRRARRASTEEDGDLAKRSLLRRKCRARAWRLHEKLIKIYGGADPLSEFIRTLSINFQTQYVNDAIDGVNEQVYLRILKILDDKFAQSFYVKLLIAILKDWYACFPVTQLDHFELLYRIQYYINDVYENYVEDVVEITCSLKELKCLCDGSDESATVPQYVLNWPHISVRVSLPEFSMLRKIHTIDDYYLTKKLKYSDGVPQNTGLCCVRSDESFAIPSETIVRFLVGLVDAISDRRCPIGEREKINLIEAIHEFETDVKLCGSAVECLGEYRTVLNQYPYMRSIAETRSAEPIRLIQYSSTVLSFTVDAEAFRRAQPVEITPDSLNNLRIAYKCELCNENLDSVSSSGFAEHFSSYHGYENDWYCVECDRTLSTDQLSKNRWKHDCIITFC